jgi:capsular polysaccharide transport system permease protein
LYYTFIATDRYASTAGFSVRGIEGGSGLDSLGALTGLASAGSTTADSYIVLKYLKSRALIESLDADLNLKEVYSNQEIDWLSRLKSEAPIEEFMDYWVSRISTQYDPSSSIIEFTVQSFTSQHALQTAERIIQLTHKLVNDLSAKARQDSLRFAEREVQIQEQRLRNALEAIREFRTVEQSLDPSATAALDIELLANLEARLIDINAKISVQREALNEDAPSLIALRRQAEALKTQIAKRRAEISGKLGDEVNSSAVTAQLTTFESLDVERRFAEQSYASALDSLEQARRDADRQQRYLAVHLHPQAAELSEYPRRLRNVLVAAFVFFATWAIGTLVSYSVRDHLT